MHECDRSTGGYWDTDFRKYDAVILAVAHKEFQNLDLRTATGENAVIFDVKGILPREQVDGRL